jgi:hypothetical protein
MDSCDIFCMSTLCISYPIGAVIGYSFFPLKAVYIFLFFFEYTGELFSIILIEEEIVLQILLLQYDL